LSERLCRMTELKTSNLIRVFISHLCGIKIWVGLT
jgi:hypothetical protein